MRAEIITAGLTYNYYREWAEYYGYKIDPGYMPKVGEVYEVACHGKHLDFEGYLYGLLRENGKIFIMNKKGIKLLEDIDEHGNYFLGLI
jgi:hypothetical protein